LEYGFTAWEHFSEQMQFLIACTHSDDQTAVYARRILTLNEESTECDWGNEERDGRNDSEQLGSRHGLDPEDSEAMYFVGTKIPKMSQWYFHPFDADFHPSVPHGHWQKENHPKLDVYLGWLYVKSKQTGREPRKNIVALWNDAGFRNCAKEAVRFYVDRFPHYSGWRVLNPLKLPRKRK
jgi:hypothetical protein